MPFMFSFKSGKIKYTKGVFMFDRYPELDSLRGLAALLVFSSHIYLLFHETIITSFLFKYGPLRFLVAGSEAVIFFFVLSGFVLSISFYSSQSLNYGAYVIKRICRIYFPYLVSILIAFLFRELFYMSRIEGLTYWFNDNWANGYNFNSLLDHMVLIGTFTSSINNVVWSLVHEMRISLIFPFIMFLVVKIDTVKGIGLAITMSIISIIYYNLTNPQFIGTELYTTVHYSAMFIIGALLAKHIKVISVRMLLIKRAYKIAVLITGILTYLYVHPSFVLNIFISDFDSFYRTVIDTWFVSIGSCVLIIFATSSNQLKRILRNKVFSYLGKISYSLYLTHIPVLFSSVHLLYGILNMVSICLIAIILTIMLASLMHLIIEKPSVQLGKILVKQKVKRTESIQNFGQ